MSVGTRKQASPLGPDAGLGLGEDHRDVGEVAKGDPHLLAGELPAAVRLLCPGPEVRGVRAGVRLGEAEAAEVLARAELRQPALLLLLGAPVLDRAADERGLHGDDRARRRVAAADLLDDQAVAEVVEAAAAVLLGDRRAQVAHLAEHRRELAVELLVAVVLARALDDLPVDEVARRLRDQLLLVGQVQVHRAPPADGAPSSLSTALLKASIAFSVCGPGHSSSRPSIAEIG